MRRSRWNASISRKTLRKPPGGSASSTRCGKSRSFVRPTISRLRRVIPPNPPPLRESPPTSRVLHLEPVGRAAGTVGGILALRDDAFKTHFASVREDRRAVAFDMLVEPDAGTGLGQDRCERGLADLKRITPQVLAVQFDQDRGPQPH